MIIFILHDKEYMHLAPLETLLSFAPNASEY